MVESHQMKLLPAKLGVWFVWPGRQVLTSTDSPYMDPGLYSRFRVPQMTRLYTCEN